MCGHFAHDGLARGRIQERMSQTNINFQVHWQIANLENARNDIACLEIINGLLSHHRNKNYCMYLRNSNPNEKSKNLMCPTKLLNVQLFWLNWNGQYRMQDFCFFRKPSLPLSQKAGRRLGRLSSLMAIKRHAACNTGNTHSFTQNATRFLSF